MRQNPTSSWYACRHEPAQPGNVYLEKAKANPFAKQFHFIQSKEHLQTFSRHIKETTGLTGDAYYYADAVTGRFPQIFPCVVKIHWRCVGGRKNKKADGPTMKAVKVLAELASPALAPELTNMARPVVQKITKKKKPKKKQETKVSLPTHSGYHLKSESYTYEIEKIGDGFQPMISRAVDITDENLFPKVSYMAKAHKKYRIKSFVIKYCQSSTPYSASPAVGKIYFAWMADATSSQPESIIECLTIPNCKGEVPYRDFSLRIPCDKVMRYTGAESEGGNAPNNLYHGKLLIFSDLSDSISDGSVLGRVKVEVEVELIDFVRPVSTTHGYFHQKYTGAEMAVAGNNNESMWAPSDANLMAGTLATSDKSGAFKNVNLSWSVSGGDPQYIFDLPDLSAFQNGDIMRLSILMCPVMGYSYAWPSEYQGTNQSINGGVAVSGSGLALDTTAVGNSSNFAYTENKFYNVVKPYGGAPIDVCSSTCDAYVMVTNRLAKDSSVRIYCPHMLKNSATGVNKQATIIYQMSVIVGTDLVSPFTEANTVKAPSAFLKKKRSKAVGYDTCDF